ncbi:hypothetical protein IFM46972_04826 [Aspergillus udagawae]|uniref:Uncharacterized protein n=1 Tax=Aspergillus udagawae TaxID=91492 RepID=A0A8H3NUD6_9EURO|nr:hypothetical protein IFM46972_04826 [Aspergillus udagawae]
MLRIVNFAVNNKTIPSLSQKASKMGRRTGLRDQPDKGVVKTATQTLALDHTGTKSVVLAAWGQTQDPSLWEFVSGNTKTLAGEALVCRIDGEGRQSSDYRATMTR